MTENESGRIDAAPSLKNYLCRMRWPIVLTGLLVFITHGSILFSQRFGIDTDLIMRGEHNFDRIGRQGLVWLSRLLGLEWFSLYYAQALTLLFLALAPVAFGFLYHRTAGDDPRPALSLLALGVSFIVSPFWTAQIYFLNQSAQVLFACLLIPLSLFLVETALDGLRRRWLRAVLAVLLMHVIFACYQVLIMVYVTAAATVLILHLLRDDLPGRKLARWLGFHAGCLLMGFVSYLITARLFYMSGSVYLTNQLAWTHTGLQEGLRQCFVAVLETLGNNPPNYSGFYGIYALLLLAVTAYRLLPLRGNRKTHVIAVFLAELFLIVSPYIFIFFYGTQIVDRMQLIMPLSQGGILYLALMLFPAPRAASAGFLRTAAGLAAIVLALCVYKDTVFHLSYCSRLYYTDEWIFQHDERMAEKIYYDILAAARDNGLDDSFDNYLFLGYPGISYNAASLRGSAIGYSHFQYDIEYLDRERIVCLLQNLGYPLNVQIDAEETAAFREHFADRFGDTVDAMPSYPDSGYIRYLTDDDGLSWLVIKLGEDWNR